MITDKQVEAALAAANKASLYGEHFTTAEDCMRAALEAAEAAREPTDYPNPGAHTPLRPAVTEQPPSADDALAGYQLRQMKLSGAERYGKWRECGRADYEVVSETGTLVDGDGIRWPAEARKVYAARPADARDAEDARRYRWLRAADCPSAQVIIDLAHDHSILADSEALDQHIDRAMGGG